MNPNTGDELFDLVCEERDAFALRVLVLEKVINQLAVNELTLHFGADGWFYKLHPRNVRSAQNYATALEAVVASQGEGRE